MTTALKLLPITLLAVWAVRSVWSGLDMPERNSSRPYKAPKARKGWFRRG